MINMKKLIIVESPAKASTLQKYLKDLGFKVIASKGHIRDLPINELGIDIENDFKIHDVTMDGKDDVIKMIKKEAEDADEIFLASDPDREGEKISQSISEILPKNKKKLYHRIMFNSVTKESILKAINNPGQINEKKCDAQKVRRILDRLVGYKISGILINKMGNGYSAGRVQSVALRIIVEREDEIKSFIPKSWFSIFVDFNKENIDFTSEYFGKQILKPETLENEAEANKILDLIKKKDFTVHDIKVEDKEKKSTPPFTTSKLQQEASSKLKFDTKSTMQIAQKLYEGINIKEKGSAIGLITYMRTDSVRVEPKAIEDVRTFIEKEYGNQYLPKTPNEYKDKKAGNVQDAHEAIRPTDLSLTPDKIRHDLNEEQYLLYRLIYNKFVASQMSNALLEKTTIMLKCDDYFFRTTGTVTKFDGFTKVFSDLAEEKKKVKGEDSSEDEDSKNLPKLVKDESLTPTDEPKVVKQVESPPPRFTEATLVKELEHKGIGRPSTYASIISNILGREYVIKDKQRFAPTQKGTDLCRILVKSFPREMDVKFTANVEDTLDLIEDGKVDWLTFMKEFYPEFEKQLIRAKTEIVSTRGPMDLSKYKTGIKCLSCSTGEYMIRKGKNGEFLACSNYKAEDSQSCRSTQNFKKNKKGEIKITEKEQPKASEKKCPLCSRPMAIKKSDKGDFYGCTGYNQEPKCSCIIPITTTHVICPTCKKGEIVEKVAKESKKKYWGCSNYVNCKQVFWNMEDFIKNDDEKK
jgi:DNA topoisomerase I